ncbi:hypothetical protein GCM10022237_35980 [Nocardioides ginsengisoli]
MPPILGEASLKRVAEEAKRAVEVPDHDVRRPHLAGHELRSRTQRPAIGDETGRGPAPVVGAGPRRLIRWDQ